MANIPKIIGSDIELGNFVLGLDRAAGTGREASRLLLTQMPGVMTTHDIGGYYAATPYSAASGSGLARPAATYGGLREPADPTDFGRKWLSTGGCCYIDSDHLEVCTPETTNAWDWAAAYHAELMIVRDAQRRVAAELADGMSIQVLVCNSDGRGNSWGSHLNFLITRHAFRNIFERRMHRLLWLASYQASSVIVNGLGKVGSEKAGAHVDYQLCQRADFFEEIVSIDTMFHRPIINSRDESHCFPVSEYARFHHIACDSNLCPVANVLKVGILQIMLAMVEAESEFLSSSLLLESPLDAWIAFSHDPTLEAKARTIDGEMLSALELQRRLFDSAAAFQQAGGCDGVVPRADEILALWTETLDMLAARDWIRLSGRLDWVLKKRLIEEAFESSPTLSWQSHEAKYLDMLYSSLDPEEGLFWPCFDDGVVERIVDPQRIELFKSAPPEDTRAYTRGHLIARRGVYQIDHANWDSLRIRFNSDAGRNTSLGRDVHLHGRVFTVYTDSPFGSTLHDDPSPLLEGGVHLPDTPASIRTVGNSANKETSTWNLENAQSKQRKKYGK